MRLIDAEELKLAIRNEFPDLADRIQINSIINEQPTVDAVERIEYEKMKDLAEQYKFEYECIFEAHKEVLNEVLPNRVEVVRCKDCKYSKHLKQYPKVNTWKCTLTDVVYRADDFCSYGERKEE